MRLLTGLQRLLSMPTLIVHPQLLPLLATEGLASAKPGFLDRLIHAESTTAHRSPITRHFSLLTVIFHQAIERVYDLNVSTTPVEEGAPHERPHKPLLLLAALPAMRQHLREALISRFFPHIGQIQNQQSAIDNHQSDLRIAEEPLEYGRSSALRRLILDLRDYQCAACGLRIKLPSGNDVSFTVLECAILPRINFPNPILPSSPKDGP